MPKPTLGPRSPGAARLPRWAQVAIFAILAALAGVCVWEEVAILHFPLWLLGRNALTVLGGFTALTWAGEAVRDLRRAVRSRRAKKEARDA